MLVKESLNFERGLDPKQSMDIGLEGQIRNFMDEKTSSSPAYYISSLLRDVIEDIDEETRIKWIKFLLTKKEYTTDLDENDYLELREQGIEWIPFVPFKDDSFKYKLVGNQYFIEFTQWADFSDYFDTTFRDISKEFIEGVLSGDGFEYFDYDLSAFQDITDLSWIINRTLKDGKQINALKDLKNKAIEMGADSSKIETLDDLLDEIQSNEDLSELCYAVQSALAEATALADENEAYHLLIKAIQKHYNIEEAKWDREKEIFIARCDFDGIKRLSFSMATGEEKIIYYAPQSYNGDITAESIDNSLENKLSDL